MSDDRAAAAGRSAPSPFDRLPDRAIRTIIDQNIFAAAASERCQTITTLLQLSKRVRSATLAHCFEEIAVADDEWEHTYPRPNTRLHALLSRPESYATLVKRLVVAPPKKCEDQASPGSTMDSDSVTSLRPLDPQALRALLSVLPELTAVTWDSDRPPFPAFCTLLAEAAPKICNLQVRSSSYKPTSKPSSPRLRDLDLSSDHGEEARTRWIPDGIDDFHELHHLHLSQLSLEGWKVLSAAVPVLWQLENLGLDCQFVEDSMLAQVGDTCKRLKHLRISTNGTKMTAKGIAALLSGCYALESLVLEDVEGRLPRDTWSQIEPASEHLRTLRYRIREDGPHHSWTTDHLDSIFDMLQAAPSGLAELTVTRHGRGEGSTEAHGTGPHPTSTPPLDPAVQTRPLPRGALDRLASHGASLRLLNIDFFSVTGDDLKAILKACPDVRTLQVCLDFSFSKMLAKSCLFIHSSHLRELNVSVLEQHCPWVPSDKVLFAPNYAFSTGAAAAAASPFSSCHANGLTAAAKVLSSPDRKNKPIVEGSPARRASSDGNAVAGLRQGEHIVPPRREVRRFARRCPSLQVLRWIGRHGQGEWTIVQGSQHIDYISYADTPDDSA